MNDTLEDYSILAIEKMRWLLMIAALLYTYSFYSGLENISAIVFGFAFPALFIISGYLVLWSCPDTEQRILRTIRRTAICCIILLAADIALSLVVDFTGTLTMLTSKAFWVNLLALNICYLPVGSTIWYVQALLYAYVIVYVLFKCKLLKFDLVLAILCLCVTLYTGELSSLFGFEFLGHAYLGGNFLTRALPYILIGCFIQRKREFFNEHLDLISNVALLIVGIFLTVGEYLALELTGYKSYVGHLLGVGVIAVALCFFCFFVEGMQIDSEILGNLSRFEIMIPYFVSSPIYYVIMWFFAVFGKEGTISYFSGCGGVLTITCSIVVVYLYGYIRNNIDKRKRLIAELKGEFDE